ncbi:unnamed protein product [Caenorhabditis brenneri]
MQQLLLLVAVLPALLSAAPISARHFPARRFIVNPDDASLQFMEPDLTSDPTTFEEFTKHYVKLFEEMMTSKTRESFQAYDNLLDHEMMFNECNAPKYENYHWYVHWLQQFVNNHSDPKIKIEKFNGDKEKGEMLLNIDVETKIAKARLNFDMKVSCMNDQGLGWKVLFVDRSKGCN